jgi:hypothetical protein
LKIEYSFRPPNRKAEQVSACPACCSWLLL